MELEKRNLIEEYEINPFTMVIAPTVYGSKVYSKIYEVDQEFLSPFRTTDIIVKGCLFFGVSYEGRKQGTKELLGYSHKLPIAVEPANSMYFFPTTSPSKSNCFWISHEHILSHQRVDRNHSIITFRNKKTLTLPVSYSSLNNQLYRTSMLRVKLSQRIEETQRKTFLMLNRPNYIKD